MCKSTITFRKFLKLLLAVEFYYIIINLAFVLSGYSSFTLKEWLVILWPIKGVGDNFVSCFLLFYLFIPFLNVLVQHLDKQMHRRLILLCLFVYTFLGMSHFFPVTMNYVSWFCILFIIASYIRFYGFEWKGKSIKWGWMTFISIIISSASIIAIRFTEVPLACSYLVADSNRLMAIIIAICSFMWFKDLKIQQSRLINTIAASTFGVLLIHANSDTMRHWLWRDTLNNVGQYGTDTFVLHMIGSVLAVYLVCTLIDYLRIRFIERPAFMWIDKYLARNKIE